MEKEYILEISNPFGIASNAMTEEEFLTINGLSGMSDFGIDRFGGANQRGLSEKQRAKCMKECKKEWDNFYLLKNKAKEAYNSLIKAGTIRKKTPIEESLTKAQGHSDNEAVQAARRMCQKRGYDWRTGLSVSSLHPGMKVKCIKMEDMQAVPKGTIGIISHIDDINTIHVKWETGSSLGLILGEDEFEVLKEVESNEN